MMDGTGNQETGARLLNRCAICGKRKNNVRHLKGMADYHDFEPVCCPTCASLEKDKCVVGFCPDGWHGEGVISNGIIAEPPEPVSAYQDGFTKGYAQKQKELRVMYEQVHKENETLVRQLGETHLAIRGANLEVERLQKELDAEKINPVGKVAEPKAEPKDEVAMSLPTFGKLLTDQEKQEKQIDNLRPTIRMLCDLLILWGIFPEMAAAVKKENL